MSLNELNENVKRLKDNFPEYQEYDDDDVALILHHNPGLLPTIVEPLPQPTPHATAFQIDNIGATPPHHYPDTFWANLWDSLVNDWVVTAENQAKIQASRAQVATSLSGIRTSRFQVDVTDADTARLHAATNKGLSLMNYEQLSYLEESRRIEYEYQRNLYELDVHMAFQVRFQTIAEAEKLMEHLLKVHDHLSKLPKDKTNQSRRKMLEMIITYGERRIKELLQGKTVPSNSGEDSEETSSRNPKRAG